MAESPEFRLQIVAAPDEVDELEHVSNIVYLQWVLRVAQAHSDAVGYTWPAYVRRHEIDYLRSAYAGDTIELVTWIERWRGASCTRCTAIRRVADGVELAKASTLWAMVSLETGRPARIPTELRGRFSSAV